MQSSKFRKFLQTAAASLLGYENSFRVRVFFGRPAAVVDPGENGQDGRGVAGRSALPQAEAVGEVDASEECKF
jgi:hypothetical protein